MRPIPNVTIRHLRRAVLLGALLLPASLPADGRAAARPAGEGRPSGPSTGPGPGRTGPPQGVTSRGLQMRFRLRGTPTAQSRGG